MLAMARVDAQGVLYVTTANSQQIKAYDLTTQQVTGTGTALANAFFGFSSSVATDSSGNVYVAFNNGGSDWIQKYDASGAVVTSFGTNGTVQVVANTLVGAGGVNPAGTLFVQSFNANLNEIRGYDTTTGATASGFTTVSLNNPSGIAFNPSGTFFYASMPSGALQGSTVTRYSSSGGAGTQITFTGGGYSNNGFDNAKGLFFPTDTTMIVVSTSLGEVERYTLSGNTATLDPTFGTSGSTHINSMTGGIAGDASGNLYLTTLGGVTRLSASGAILDSAFVTDSNSPSKLAIYSAAIPEPSPVAMLAGLIALGGASRFRRRK